MSGKLKYIAMILCIAVLACVLFIVYGMKTEQTENKPDVEISMRISKDKLISLLEDTGVRLRGKSRMAVSLLPDTLTLVFDMQGKEKGKLSDIKVNGKKVSYEILSDICENYLDFSCDLVYN